MIKRYFMLGKSAIQLLSKNKYLFIFLENFSNTADFMKRCPYDKIYQLFTET